MKDNSGPAFPVERTIELLRRLMDRNEVKERLRLLHKGIGTATDDRIYIDLENLLAELAKESE